LKNINKDREIANNFYSQYYFTVLHEVLFVATDKSHKAGYEQQRQIIRTLFLALDAVDIDSNV